MISSDISDIIDIRFIYRVMLISKYSDIKLYSVKHESNGNVLLHFKNVNPNKHDWKITLTPIV